MKCNGKTFFRDIIDCIQLLIGHLHFKDFIDYEPIQLHATHGFRVYNEINTRHWWWGTQGKISTGGTLIPVPFGSDKT
jgi:hypothetical protein